MKKILRLVTTSVLTLTLVACGEASSSVASSTPASSSVSSPVTSTFAAVTRIDLSAATDSLTQVLGAQKAVVVTATLSANANPATPVEWFVDGAKSNQTGRVFEFTPAKAGTFVISARVGSVNSTSTISVAVGAGSFAITGDVKVVDNNTIEVVAPGGAEVAVTNNELLPASFYDIKEGKYVIELKTALKQGDSATVTLTRDGLTASKLFTFDTRVLEGEVAGLTAQADGTFKITKPHKLTTTGALNNIETVYSLEFLATNIGKSTPVAYQFSLKSAPVGADAYPTQTGLISVATGEEKAAGSYNFKISKDTLPGNYVYEYSVDGIIEEVVIVVADPIAEAKLQLNKEHPTASAAGEPIEFDSITGLRPAYAYSYGLRYRVGAANMTSGAGDFGVAANADGSFDIEKPYLSGATDFIDFEFVLDFNNFLVPDNLITQLSVEPNQISTTILGPNNVTSLRLRNGETPNAPKEVVTFRVKSDDYTVTQRIDSATVAGKYTFTVKVNQIGATIYSKDIVINIKEPTPSLSLVINEVEYEANFAARVAGYQKEISEIFMLETEALFEAKTDFATWGTTYFGATPATALTTTEYNDLKAHMLAKNLLMVPYLTFNQSQSLDAYEAAKAAWVNSFIASNPLATVTNLAGLITKLETYFPSTTDILNIFAATAATNYGLFVNDYVDALILNKGIVAFTTAAEYRAEVEKLFPVYQTPFNANELAWATRIVEFAFGKNRADFLAKTGVSDLLDGGTITEAEYIDLKNYFINDLLSQALPFTVNSVTWHNNLSAYTTAKEYFALTSFDSASATAFDTLTELIDVLKVDFAPTNPAVVTGLTDVFDSDEETAVSANFLNIFGTEVAKGLGVTSNTDLDSPAKRKLAFSNLFPKFDELEIPSSAKATGVNLKLVDGVYVIEKPLLVDNDTRTLFIDALIKNYESPVNNIAANSNSFTGTDTFKKELLDYVEVSSVLGTIGNLANDVATKIAIELGVSAGDAGLTTISSLDPTSTASFKRFRSATNQVRLDNIFTLDVKFLSVVGNYVFNVKIGDLNQNVTIRVVEPAPKLDFKVLTATNNLPSATFNFVRTAEGKFTATLPTKELAATPSVVAKVSAQLLNSTGVAISGSTKDEASYTLTKVTPSTSDTKTNVIKVEPATGNDGHLVGKITSNATTLQPESSALLSLFTFTSGDSTFKAGSNIGSNVDDFTEIVITEKGVYSFNLTLNGVNSSIELTVLEAPTLKLEEVRLGTTLVGPVAGLGYVFEENDAITTSVTANFFFSNKGLPTKTLYYKVFDLNLDASSGSSGSFTISQNTTDFFVRNVTGVSDATLLITGIEPLANAFDLVPATPLDKLDFVGDKAAVKIVVDKTANETSTVLKVEKVVGIYELIPTSYTSANATKTVVDANYKLLGYAIVEFFLIDAKA